MKGHTEQVLRSGGTANDQVAGLQGEAEYELGDRLSKLIAMNRDGMKGRCRGYKAQAKATRSSIQGKARRGKTMESKVGRVGERGIEHVCASKRPSVVQDRPCYTLWCL
jgi:hypothetical protein